MALPAIVGAVGGAVLAGAFVRAGPLARWMFPADLAIVGPWPWLVVATVPLLMGVAAAVATRGPAVSDAGPRPAFVPDPPVPRPVVAVVAALVCLGSLVASQRSAGLTAATAWWSAAMVAFGVALVAGSRSLVVRAARGLADRVDRPTIRAALRRIECHGRAPLSVGLLLGVVTLAAATFGPVVITLLGQSHIAAYHLALREQLPTAVSFVETTHPLGQDELTSVVARAEVRALPREDGGNERVLVAGCDDVRALLADDALPCHHDVWRLAASDEPVDGHISSGGLLRGDGRPLAVTAVVDSGRSLDDLAPWTVVSPEVLASTGPMQPLAGHLLATPSDTQAVDTLRIELARLVPGANLYVPHDPAIVGAGRWRPVAAFGIVLLGASLAIGLLAAVLVLAPLTAARDRPLRAWSVIGAPTRFLRGSQWLYCWLPSTFPVAAGAAFGVVALTRGRTLGLVASDLPIWSAGILALAVLGGLAIACVVVVLIPPSPVHETGG